MTSSRKRDFVVKLNDKNIKLYICAPTQEELFEIDMEYRVAMTKLLKGGVMTRQSAAKLLAESGDWTAADDSNMNNILILLAKYRNDIDTKQKEQTHEDNMKIIGMINDLRDQHRDAIMRKNDLFDNCAEHLAEQQKMHTFARLCVHCEDDDTLFFRDKPHYEKFLSENIEAASQIFAETYAFEYQVAEDLIDELPEVTYVKKYEAQRAEAEKGKVDDGVKKRKKKNKKSE
jgi:hypothetical protein